MADKKLPNYNSKQKLLYINRTAASELINFGDMFLADGRISDALDFYAQAKHNEGIQKIKELSFASGDVMLFARAAKALSQELQPADWDTVGQKALAAKKYCFARHALEKTNNQAMLDHLKKTMEAEESDRQI